ncbi:hypothetical protein T265_03576 [Opisthorchis viverrini]|uniref:Uncharacterized protein n=1 Tax=Opisthorchis viverrini TaxID=6198 RepID=A0A074ZVH4_OPIVI|nr:hypothetical protein T265_03576 [Opisthorchis viverrini]KER29882.1 hypothetical protein T265_03576 [Opisthorchis viverrini]
MCRLSAPHIAATNWKNNEQLGQPGSIPALVQLSSDMAARHRKGATAERHIEKSEMASRQYGKHWGYSVLHSAFVRELRLGCQTACRCVVQLPLLLV